MREFRRDRSIEIYAATPREVHTIIQNRQIIHKRVLSPSLPISVYVARGIPYDNLLFNINRGPILLFNVPGGTTTVYLCIHGMLRHASIPPSLEGISVFFCYLYFLLYIPHHREKKNIYAFCQTLTPFSDFFSNIDNVAGEFTGLNNSS